MSQFFESTKVKFKRTRLAVIGTSILNEPLWSLYTLFAFILHKDLHSTALQIAVLTMMRPLVSILSMYWSASVARRPEKMLSNVIYAGVLSRLPFFFFPLIDNAWILIGTIVFYMMLYRGGLPAWIEILKQNLPGNRRGAIYSLGSTVGYLEGVVLAIGVGYLLDVHSGAWRWMFPLSAGIGLVGVLLQARIPVEWGVLQGQEKAPKSVQDFLFHPWKNTWNLLTARPDFRGYQWATMLCGMGIMLIQPALPLFFVDVLNLSYTDLAIALSICKGLGFAVTSPVWGRWLHKVSIYQITMVVFIFMGGFPLLLLFAPMNVAWLFGAYVVYGVAQAGSHLAWNLSGTLFAENENSSLYSSVNVMMVGLRGAVIPPLGSVVCIALGPIAVLLSGSVLCLLGGWRMLILGKKWIATTHYNVIRN